MEENIRKKFEVSKIPFDFRIYGVLIKMFSPVQEFRNLEAYLCFFIKYDSYDMNHKFSVRIGRIQTLLRESVKFLNFGKFL